MLSVRCLSVCPVCLSCLSVLSVTLVYCGQMVGRIKMNFGMQVGLGPGDFVMDGYPATPTKEGTPTPPNYWPMFIVAKRLDGWRHHLVRK